jgi:DNA-binding response OmpR family regulator
MSRNISSLNLSGKNIVIVDDDLPSVRYLEIMLKNTGANTIVFHTGKAFVDYLEVEDKGIDIVFMDFLIPIINGIECVSEFRRERKNVPVIMITAYTSDQAKKDAFISGCNEYILKPIYPEKIFSILEKYLMPNSSVPSSY